MARAFLIAAVSLLFLGGAFVYLMVQMEREPGGMNSALPTGIFEISGREMIVELAKDSASKRRGLSYRTSLEEDQGMLFLYDEPSYQTFWMHGMRFPLDIIFIRGEEVVEVVPDVPPPGNHDLPTVITSSVRADSVLEVNAGKADALGIVEGATAILRN